ncbi:MAG: GNAT family N-acetyltransferase [Myxococcota bacterium]
MISVRTVRPEDRHRFVDGIRALESGAVYPLGDDHFRIDHGEDYFAFFDRLGALRFEVALDAGEVVACAAGILRDVPIGDGAQRCWYLCDLKVRPDYRGRRIPFRMLLSAFPSGYAACSRGYGISMNSAGDAENRVARMVKRFRLVPIEVDGPLQLYALTEGEMRRFRPRIEAELGPITFLSLGGVKDIVLESSGAPMPLLHVQHGPCAAVGLDEPQPGHQHMFCIPAGSPLAEEMKHAHIAINSTATVVSHGMRGADWRFVLTSDI